MTDRELLEMAAKAAGFYWRVGADFEIQRAYMTWEVWNPLTDDGDALRLAVKLGLGIDAADGTPDGCGDTPATRVDASDGRMLMIEAHYQDPYAATRRAIVRAAAEIGKAMS